MRMTSLISPTQKTILMAAVDTSNAKFIAECVVNIEEIITCIKDILSLSVSSTPGWWLFIVSFSLNSLLIKMASRHRAIITDSRQNPTWCLDQGSSLKSS